MFPLNPCCHKNRLISPLPTTSYRSSQIFPGIYILFSRESLDCSFTKSIDLEACNTRGVKTLVPQIVNRLHHSFQFVGSPLGVRQKAPMSLPYHPQSNMTPHALQHHKYHHISPQTVTATVQKNLALPAPSIHTPPLNLDSCPAHRQGHGRVQAGSRVWGLPPPSSLF